MKIDEVNLKAINSVGYYPFVDSIRVLVEKNVERKNGLSWTGVPDDLFSFLCVLVCALAIFLLCISVAPIFICFKFIANYVIVRPAVLQDNDGHNETSATLPSP